MKQTSNPPQTAKLAGDVNPLAITGTQGTSNKLAPNTFNDLISVFIVLVDRVLF